MPHIFVQHGGGSPGATPDDDKAERAAVLHWQLDKMLADPAFVAKLPDGVKDRLERHNSQLWFQLAIYRGELSKRHRAQYSGTPLALAGTTTFPPTDSPADLFLKIAAFAIGAIALVVCSRRRNYFIPRRFCWGPP